MKKLITFGLFCLCYISVMAQHDIFFPDKNSHTDLICAKQRKVSGTIGSAILFSSQSTFFSISPRITYQVTPKFVASLGLAHLSSFNSLFIPISSITTNGEKINYCSKINFLSLQGSYAASKKVTISVDVQYGRKEHLLKENTYKAMNLGMEYKLSPHASIGLKTTVIQTNGNFLYASPIMDMFSLQNGFSSQNSFGTSPSLPYKNNFY